MQNKTLEVGIAHPSRRNWALVAALLATFMTVLDNNIVNVAIPTMQRSLHLSQAGIEWVVSAYILFFAGLLLAGGRLADVFGRRRLFVVGLVTFTAASLAAGLATTEGLLIVARAVQGIGAALLVPTTLSIVTHAFREPKEQARAIGLWGAVGALALATGPVIGGVVTQDASWNWIFFLNVPIGVLTLVVGLIAIPRERILGRRSLDTPGVVASAVGLFALTYALIEGTHFGWTSPIIVASFAVSVAAAIWFISIERRSNDPMLELSIFSNRNFRVGTIVLSVWAFGLFGIYFFTAIYLQDVLGFSPTKAGLAFVPMAVMMAIGATISDRVVARTGANRLIGTALVLMGIGIASVSLLGPNASFADLMPGLLIIGVTGGFTIPLTSIVISTMPLDRAGVASGVFNATREVAGLLGITVIGVVLSARQSVALHAGDSPTSAFLAGYRWGLLIAASLVALGGVVAYIGLPARARRVTSDVDHFNDTALDHVRNDRALQSLLTLSV